MINVDFTMIGSLHKRIMSSFSNEIYAIVYYLKNIDTQMNAKAAESEMYCGSAHRR